MIKNNVVTKDAGAPSGWNAAALSLLGISGSGSAFFQAGGSVVGAVAGFNSAAQGAGFVEIDHGFRFAGGSAFVVESGVDAHAVGAYAEYDEFEIRRDAQAITYYRNGVLLYTSTVPSIGSVFLDVSLYSAGDHVFNPRLVLGAGGSYVEASAEAGVSTLTGYAVGAATLSVSETIVLAVIGHAVGDATITAGEIVRAALRGIAVGSARLAPTSEEALTLSLVAVGRGSIKAIGYGQETVAFNLENGGTTRYEGFDFNSYAKIGDGYFGCKADGIYQLDGNTDAGEPIRSMVSFGKQDFGTSALKRITNAYVGVSGQGRLFLKVMAEGQEYTYAARSYDENIQVQRFDTGKGLRVNWLEFELYNADGEDFELASVEFAVVPTSRRI